MSDSRIERKSSKSRINKEKNKNTLRCPNPRGSDLSGHYNPMGWG